MDYLFGVGVVGFGVAFSISKIVGKVGFLLYFVDLSFVRVDVYFETESSKVGTGILNFECAVLPSGNNRDAIPLDATVSTILRLDRSADANVFQTISSASQCHV